MKMLTIVAGFCLAYLLAACSAPEKDGTMLGADHDAHGCIASAGYSWSVLQQQCVQPWEAAHLKLDDPQHATSAVYVIFAPDQSSAEVFALGVAQNTLLEPVKGGFATKNGSLRLIKQGDEWYFYRR